MLYVGGRQISKGLWLCCTAAGWLRQHHCWMHHIVDIVILMSCAEGNTVAEERLTQPLSTLKQQHHCKAR